MQQIPGLNRSAIQANTSSGSYKRGKRYYEGEAIRAMEHRAGDIHAQVQGTEVLPYRVHITYDDTGIREATCSCPYQGSNWCKHIAAVLLAVVNDTEDADESLVAALLADADKDELLRLIERLVERDPKLLGWIEEERPSR